MAASDPRIEAMAQFYLAREECLAKTDFAATAVIKALEIGTCVKSPDVLMIFQPLKPLLLGGLVSSS
ncbi:MAG: hypothetical protein M3Y21_00820 [Candidatus Eremiobacteraeota bacterium]|nr:hypothetical protein [Candidatus Eremiobacteraeota bacterium]